MNIELLQKIARSNEHQIFYNRSKELHLRLFNNDSNLSKLQIFYLYFLQMYSILYTDLAMGEDYISEDVIQDEIRTEAYLLLRKEKKEKTTKITNNKNVIDSAVGQGSVIFKRKIR